MRVVKKNSVIKINKYYNLVMDPHTQDWFVECADKNKILQFLDGYGTTFKSDDDCFALMELILGSFEILTEEDGFQENIWSEIANILKSKKALHSDTIDYWALEDESDDNNLFCFTKRIRALKANSI